VERLGTVSKLVAKNSSVARLKTVTAVRLNVLSHSWSCFKLMRQQLRRLPR